MSLTSPLCCGAVIVEEVDLLNVICRLNHPFNFVRSAGGGQNTSRVAVVEYDQFDSMNSR